MAEKTALVLLADGCEEMEATVSINILRRAGVKAVIGLVGGSKGIVEGSRGIRIAGDVSLQEALSMGPYDAVVMPGGMGGSKALAGSAAVQKLVREQYESGRIVAAICAAPALVLPSAGVGEGRRVTCYPSMETHFGDKYTYVPDKKVVVDGNLITSQGPGTAYEFALKISAALVGEEKAKSVRKALLL